MFNGVERITEMNGQTPKEVIFAVPEETYENDLQESFIAGKRIGTMNGLLVGSGLTVLVGGGAILFGALCSSKNKDKHSEELEG